MPWLEGGGEEESNQAVSFSNFFLGRGKNLTSSLINPLVSEKGTEEVLVEKGNLFTFLFRGILRRKNSGSHASKPSCLFLGLRVGGSCLLILLNVAGKGQPRGWSWETGLKTCVQPSATLTSTLNSVLWDSEWAECDGRF